MDDERVSIYRASRTIKRRENSLYNALRSIYEDSIFVGEIAQLWPELPLVANLRCGLWYSSKFESNCYFKSTDGHNNNWSFNTSRLNLHVALLAGISLSLSLDYVYVHYMEYCMSCNMIVFFCLEWLGLEMKQLKVRVSTGSARLYIHMILLYELP